MFSLLVVTDLLTYLLSYPNSRDAIASKNTGKGLWSNLQNVNKSVMVILQYNIFLGKVPSI